MKIAMGFEIGLAFQASVVKVLNLNPVSRKQLKNLDLISFKMSEFIFFRQILWTFWIRPCLLPIYFTIWSNHGLWSIGRNERPDIWHAKCILATFRINYRLVTICWFSSLLVPFWLNEMVRFWVSSHFLGKHGRNVLKFGMLIMYADHLHNWLDYGHGLFNFSNFGELLLMKQVKYGLSGYFSETQDTNGLEFSMPTYLTTFKLITFWYQPLILMKVWLNEKKPKMCLLLSWQWWEGIATILAYCLRPEI